MCAVGIVVLLMIGLCECVGLLIMIVLFNVLIDEDRGVVVWL